MSLGKDSQLCVMGVIIKTITRQRAKPQEQEQREKNMQESSVLCKAHLGRNLLVQFLNDMSWSVWEVRIMCVLLSPRTWILWQLRAGREKSFSPSCANFLISTKRHLNHLSVRNGSSRKRRQAGRQNKQPTLLHPTHLGINGQKQQGEAADGLLNLLCSHQHADRFSNNTAKQYGACGDSAQRSVNKHFHAERWAYNTVSGSCNECGEAEGAISQPPPRRDAGPPPHTQTTNHHGTEIDVSSGFEIYHPDQVAAQTLPDRLLNKA